MSVGKSALAPVHAALYGVLSADATLAALCPGGVWDHVPQNEAFPYIRIGQLRAEPNDTFGLQFRDVVVSVHVFSTYAGLKEAYDINARVIALLRHTPLTVAGWTHLATLLEAETADEPIPLDESVMLQHVDAEFRVQVQETV